MCRNAFGNSDYLVIHNQDPVVLARHETLDDHRFVATFTVCHRKELCDLVIAGQIDANTSPVIAIAGLEHHRILNAPGSPDRVLDIARRLTARHRYPDIMEQPVCELLVFRDLNSNVGSFRGDGGPNSPLEFAVPKLYERSSRIEAKHWNAAAFCFLHDCAGRWAIRQSLGNLDHHFQLALIIEVCFRLVEQVVQEPECKFPGSEPDIFLVELEGDVVNTFLASAPCLASPHLGPRKVLHLQGDVFHHVAHPGAFAQAFEEATRLANRAAMVIQRRNQFHELFVKPGDLVGRAFFQLTDIHHIMDYWHPGPNVWPSIDGRFPNLQH